MIPHLHCRGSIVGKVKVAAFSLSLDGYGAGPNQDLHNPLGVGGRELHSWFFPTAAFQKKVLGKPDGTMGVDNDFAEKSFENIGANILGRNMFGPVRGPWLDDSWKGWWGDNPPYHTPVYVLTHHPREPLQMAGDTTFYFVTDGIESALKQAKAAAKGKDVRIGGGVSLVKQYLKAGLIDEMHLVMSPVLLGSGENLFAGIDLAKLGYQCVESVAGINCMHLVLRK